MTLMSPRMEVIHVFSHTKFTFSRPKIFYPLFLNEDDRIKKTRPSKLHYRCASLTETILLESQSLQSYDHLLQILA